MTNEEALENVRASSIEAARALNNLMSDVMMYEGVALSPFSADFEWHTFRSALLCAGAWHMRSTDPATEASPPGDSTFESGPPWQRRKDRPDLQQVDVDDS